MSLRVIRLATGKGLNQAAREAGVKGPQLSQWETGKIAPSTKNLVKLAAFYGCTIDALLRQDDATAAEVVS